MINNRHFICFLALTMILGCHKGYLALFRTNDPLPLKTYPYRLEVFPPEDQAGLRQGIPVSSEEELTRLLQDYLS